MSDGHPDRERDDIAGYEAMAKNRRPQNARGPVSTVDHPAHYGGGDNPYEAIKVIEAWHLDFCLGNAVKYISRAGKKTASPREDLEKAIWYLQRRLKQVTDVEITPHQKHLK